MRGEVMKIVVIGGTGLIGSKVVEKLKQKGHEAIAAAPNTGVNTITGEGLKEALAGAEVVIDLENSPSFEDEAVLEFFETAGRNLLSGGNRSPRPAPCRAVHRRNRPDRQWLFPRQGRPRETDQGIQHPLHHHPRDAVLGIPQRHR
jgi:NAD(P)-dependent dehydrogenase (short-subunit alcohol dehydrogenase family)